MTADERSFWLEIRRGYLTQLRAIDQRLGIHSSYRVDREPPAKPEQVPANHAQSKAS